MTTPTRPIATVAQRQAGTRRDDRFSRHQVRMELYDLRQDFARERDRHVMEAWNTAGKHDRGACETCWLFEGRIQGLERALRRFGAAVRGV